MKANELRIGNIIKNKNVTCTVEGILNDFDLFVSDDYEEWYPELKECESIPLTEEWLLKFGYKKVNTVNNNTEVFEKKFSYTVYLTNGVLSMSFGAVKIKYVHQLQNLYFALTGEELTIKQ